MTRSSTNPWLHRFAILTAIATLGLVCVGGLVTSHGAGLSVPDWPTTYGYNMFFFPLSKMTGGVLYEHSHRLIASAVGLLTIGLAVGLWLREARAWLRGLGVLAVGLVIGQGVLGGLRVTMLKDELGIFHATLAQLFLVLIAAIALFTSRWWTAGTRTSMPTADRKRLRCFFGVTTGIILLQLVLGATMRHQHAGLAIPDFPTAYGKWWPDLDAMAIERYNQARNEVTAVNAITAFQVVLQMAHRLTALVILVLVVWSAAAARKRAGAGSVVSRLAVGWAGLVGAQVLLGVITIWTNKAADITTLHVAAGALTMVTGAILMLLSGHEPRPVPSEGAIGLPLTTVAKPDRQMESHT